MRRHHHVLAREQRGVNLRSVDHRLEHGAVGEAEAMAGYENARDEQLRTIFEITCELVSFPDTRRFLELQKALGMAIDAQAEILAAQPSLPLSDAA